MRLNDAESTMVAVYEHWGQDLLVNPRFVRKQQELSWEGGRTFLPNLIHFDDVITLEERREYTFQTVDGSIVQIYYRFDTVGTSVTLASLAYVHASPYAQSGAQTLVPWFRIDYDPELARGPTHACCHMHISLAPETRIPVNSLPSPAQFIEMIAAWFYPDVFAQKRVDPETSAWRSPKQLEWVHGSGMKATRSDVAKLTHLALPSALEG